MNKLLVVLGTLLFVGGLVFSLLPHEAHNALLAPFAIHEVDDHDAHEHGTHEEHETYGFITAAAGAALVLIGWKLLK